MRPRGGGAAPVSNFADTMFGEPDVLRRPLGGGWKGGWGTFGMILWSPPNGCGPTGGRGGGVAGVPALVRRRLIFPQTMDECTSNLLVYPSRSLALYLLNSEGFKAETILPKAAMSNAVIWAGVLGIYTPEISHSLTVTCPEK